MTCVTHVERIKKSSLSYIRMYDMDIHDLPATVPHLRIIRAAGRSDKRFLSNLDRASLSVNRTIWNRVVFYLPEDKVSKISNMNKNPSSIAHPHITLKVEHISNHSGVI